TVAIAESRHAFAAPSKSHFRARGRLQADALDRNTGDLGDARAYRIAMRADPRRLAHDGDVKMGDAPTSRTHTFYRECQEPIGRSAPPLRIGRGKMHTDIALGERTEKGIDERMKNDVGIRMPGQSARMGHAH